MYIYICVCVCVCVYLSIYAIIRGAFNKFPDIFFYWHLKLSMTLENSVCYCYTYI